jgi:flavodoxin
MRSIIIFHSYSGNTRQVAQILAEYLKPKSEVEMLELKAQDESASFLGQCRRALWHKRGQIAPAKFTLEDYDLICLGTPVWAFGPAPAVNTYLDKCAGVKGKAVVLFTTYGSGTGNTRCLNYMQAILTKKGAKTFKRFSVQQFKVGDEEYVLSKIKEVLG